jgi:hypothetical protein
MAALAPGREFAVLDLHPADIAMMAAAHSNASNVMVRR